MPKCVVKPKNTKSQILAGWTDGVERGKHEQTNISDLSYPILLLHNITGNMFYDWEDSLCDSVGIWLAENSFFIMVTLPSRYPTSTLCSLL